jgi:glycosyltransferase involved in cell wall biosynthesis
MTVGFFSPLPPAPTGVADYAASLLSGLRAHGQVEVDDEQADAALYHIGNNQLHRAIYERALARPGLAVLHDAVLQHFFLGSLDEASYVSEFVHNYGRWMTDFAGELWASRARSAADPRYFEYPMLKRIAERSRAVIVHNAAAARAVRRHAPEARIEEIPHLFVPPAHLPSESETGRFRAELGLGPRTLLAGVLGHQRETKRFPVVMRALDRASRAGADLRLLVAGNLASTDLERALAPMLADPRVIRVGYLPELEFWRYAAAVDVCLNLRFPTAGETSGIAIRLMGIGKPVIFTAGEELARIPENAALRVDMGALEEEMLAGYVVWLAQDREAAREIGCRAAAHIAHEHSLDRVAQRYWNVLKTLGSA